MPRPPQPSLSLSVLSGTSVQANVALGSDTAVNTFYYRRPGGLSDRTYPTTLTGNGSLSLTGLATSSSYVFWVVAYEPAWDSYSLPSLGWVSLSTSDTLSAALHRHFNSSGALAAALSGGLWTGEVPEGTALPYGWLDIADVSTSPTFEQQYEAARVVVSLFAAGAAAAEQLAGQFKADFDYQVLSFTDPTTACIMLLPRRYRLLCEMVRAADSTLVYRAVLTYHILLQKAKP